MLSRRMLALAVLALLLSGCGGGNGDETEAEAEQPAVATKTTPTVASPVRIDRADLRDCLAEAGLAPKNAGLFVISSGGTNVEALGVRTDVAGRVLLFAFEEDAAEWKDYVTKQFAADAAEVRIFGNVILAYENAPSEDERGRVEGCLESA